MAQGPHQAQDFKGTPLSSPMKIPVKFYLPNRITAQAAKVEKLEHKVLEPTNTIGVLPELVQHTLLSASKISDTDYISIYDGDEVNIYYGQTSKIKVSEVELLKGW